MYKKLDIGSKKNKFWKFFTITETKKTNKINWKWKTIVHFVKNVSPQHSKLGAGAIHLLNWGKLPRYYTHTLYTI